MAETRRVGETAHPKTSFGGARRTQGAHRDSVLFPIGHLRGAAHRDAASSHSYSLRLGTKIIGLTLGEFVVWSHAHGVEPRVREQAWTRDTVVDLVDKLDDTGLDEPAHDVIDRLTGYGVLAEVRPDAESEIAFARTHRVFPLMLGLGNTASAPWLYRIGLPHTVMSTVLPDVYELWDGLHLGNTLWAACQSLAGDSPASQRSAATDMGLDRNGPADLLHQFLGELHCLLTANCIYVDVALEQGSLG